ncbi:MAG: NAD(P)-binding domain-containing protein [Gemmataceae bacterium]|nr:NAD(P)-binding domain-containing protein [Gemmataceae bacterium]MCI0743132.1 NAD(P)-binding domain-containing protein [Gemmataceae bacterium]
MAKTETPRIAILGAGPIGLEAAACAQALGMPFTVYERGRVGEHLLRWGHVRLFSPFGMNSTPLGRSVILKNVPKYEFPADDACITGREHVSAYLTPLAEAFEDRIQTDTLVLQVGRRGLLKEDEPGSATRAQQPFRLLLRDKQNRERIEEADIVLDCTGTYAQHRWLGEGGIPAVGELAAEGQISYFLDDILGERRQHYANRNTLVVGAGFSAATTVCNLAALAADNPSAWVYWIARCQGHWPFKRIPNDPLKERDRLALKANNLAARTDDNVEFHPQTVVEAIESAGPERGFRVVTRSLGKQRVFEVERIVANVGYSPDRLLYRELQIHECYASLGPMKLAAALVESTPGKSNGEGDCLRKSSHGPESLRNPEPNFYILGSKSYGRNAQFLMRVGFEQIRDVFRLITGKADLDTSRIAK